MKNSNKKFVAGTSLIAGILLAGSAMAQVTGADQISSLPDFGAPLALTCEAQLSQLESQYQTLDTEFAITTEQLNQCSAQLTDSAAQIANLTELLTDAISGQASCASAKLACEDASATCQAGAQTLKAQLDAVKAELEKAKADLAAEQSKVANLSAQTAPSTLVVKNKLQKVITRLRFLALKPTGNLTNKVKVTSKQGLAIGKQYEAALAKKSVKVVVQN